MEKEILFNIGQLFYKTEQGESCVLHWNSSKQYKIIIQLHYNKYSHEQMELKT